MAILAVFYFVTITLVIKEPQDYFYLFICFPYLVDVLNAFEGAFVPLNYLYFSSCM